MFVATDSPRRPAFRYHGAKWLLAPWVLQFIPGPEYVDLYGEPYGGSAAVLLRKPRHLLEVWNDKSDDVVNFFAMLRQCPERLVEAVHWTPFARREWEHAGELTGDPLERARRFYVRASMSIAGPTARWSAGFRRQKVLSRAENNRRRMTPAPLSFMKLEHLFKVAERFRGVQIECDDALAMIARYDQPRAFFYCDPTYLHETRGRWQSTAYEHEMSTEEHRGLAEALKGIEGLAAVSGYAHPLYKELYEAQGWQRVNRLARTNGQGSREESLWLNPKLVRVLAEAKARSRPRPDQLGLGL